MKTWSKWGEMLPADKSVIGAIARKSGTAARIFIAGEINAGRLSQDDRDLLFASNDIFVDAGNEPLFELTRDATIRMYRFDADVVWGMLPKALVTSMVKKEAARYGAEGVPMFGKDFYRNLTQFLRDRYGLQVPDPANCGFSDFYQSVYLSAVFLFNKSGYMGVPLCRHFALTETELFLEDLRLRPLTEGELDLLVDVRERYKGIECLTNKEIDFLMGLFPTPAPLEGIR